MSVISIQSFEIDRKRKWQFLEVPIKVFDLLFFLQSGKGCYGNEIAVIFSEFDTINIEWFDLVHTVNARLNY